MTDQFIKRMFSVMFMLIFCLKINAQDSNKLKSNEYYSGPIIDVHIHVFSEKSGFNQLLGKSHPPLSGITGVKSYIAPATLEEVRQATFDKFKEHNIVKAVVYGGELWYENLPEKIIIGHNASLEVEDLRKKHAEGKLEVLGEIAPNYAGILPTDTILTEYFDLVVELDIPIAYHMFPGGPPAAAYGPYPNVRAHQGKPLQFEEILIARPTMRIYILHAGWPYLEDMKALMYAHPQVYVDLGVINWILPRKEFHNFLKGLVDAGFGKRIMFGSDQMIWPETITTGIDAINSASFLTLEQKEDIFYNNAASFFRFSEEEIKLHKGL